MSNSPQLQTALNQLKYLLESGAEPTRDQTAEILGVLRSLEWLVQPGAMMASVREELLPSVRALINALGS